MPDWGAFLIFYDRYGPGHSAHADGQEGKAAAAAQAQGRYRYDLVSPRRTPAPQRGATPGPSRSLTPQPARPHLPSPSHASHLPPAASASTLATQPPSSRPWSAAAVQGGTAAHFAERRTPSLSRSPTPGISRASPGPADPSHSFAPGLSRTPTPGLSRVSLVSEVSRGFTPGLSRAPPPAPGAAHSTISGPCKRVTPGLTRSHTPGLARGHTPGLARGHTPGLARGHTPGLARRPGHAAAGQGDSGLSLAGARSQHEAHPGGESWLAPRWSHRDPGEEALVYMDDLDNGTAHTGQAAGARSSQQDLLNLLRSTDAEVEQLLFASSGFRYNS
ncbi:hypothetical protein V8C86DRAFT_2713146 [Haematococcus lacustris]